MTNTTQLLTDAENRVQAGDVPDEVSDIKAENDKNYHPLENYICATACYEAGRLSGVAGEAKHPSVMNLLNLCIEMVDLHEIRGTILTVDMERMKELLEQQQ